MISFKVSAPGKVILFGEHAVVYGKTAIAASLNRRTYLEFTEILEDNLIQIVMPQLDILVKIDTNKVKESLLASSFPKLQDGHDEFYQCIRQFVESIGFQNPRQSSSLECVFYALIQISQKEGLTLKPFKLKVVTELSIGAGVGSSASFSVCLVAGFLRWSQLQKNPKATPTFDLASLDSISLCAQNCERIMHGKPSGIDNSICTFGSVIEFRRGEAANFIPMSLKNMRILLVDTNIGRSTKLLVDKLATLKNKYPEIFNPVIEAINEVSNKVVYIFKQCQTFSENDNEKLLEVYKELSVLIDINQALLVTCQVSHYSLDLICMSASKYGFSAKLTGAGGGGFAYVLIPPNASNKDVDKLSAELTAQGFSVKETNLGGSGVEIHD